MDSRFRGDNSEGVEEWRNLGENRVSSDGEPASLIEHDDSEGGYSAGA